MVWGGDSHVKDIWNKKDFPIRQDIGVPEVLVIDGKTVIIINLWISVLLYNKRKTMICGKTVYSKHKEALYMISVAYVLHKQATKTIMGYTRRTRIHGQYYLLTTTCCSSYISHFKRDDVMFMLAAFLTIASPWEFKRCLPQEKQFHWFKLKNCTGANK